MSYVVSTNDKSEIRRLNWFNVVGSLFHEADALYVYKGSSRKFVGFKS